VTRVPVCTWRVGRADDHMVTWARAPGEGLGASGLRSRARLFLRFDCDHIALSTYRDECLASGLSLFIDLISSTYPPDIDLPGCEGMLLLELKFCPWQIKTRRLTHRCLCKCDDRNTVWENS